MTKCFSAVSLFTLQRETLSPLQDCRQPFVMCMEITTNTGKINNKTTVDSNSNTTLVKTHPMGAINVDKGGEGI